MLKSLTSTFGVVEWIIAPRADEASLCVCTAVGTVWRSALISV